MERKNSNVMKEIVSALNGADTVRIITHASMDGDAFGSSAALCHILRGLGKRAEILLEDEIPGNLRFLDRNYCVRESGLPEEPDLCVALDCGALYRFEKRVESYQKGRNTINIDHHEGNPCFGALNWVEPDAPATGLLVFLLLRAAGWEIDAECGEALYAAIATDTGNFQYESTNKECLLAAAELCDSGMDRVKVATEIYQNCRPEQIAIEAIAVERMEYLCGGWASLSCVTQEMLRETGALMSETERIVERLRGVRGVELAVLIKEEPDRVKCSLRSKHYVDVAAIAASLGGGGHKRAAGCTMRCGLEEAAARVRAAIEKEFADEGRDR